MVAGEHSDAAIRDRVNEMDRTHLPRRWFHTSMCRSNKVTRYSGLLAVSSKQTRMHNHSKWDWEKVEHNITIIRFVQINIYKWVPLNIVLMDNFMNNTAITGCVNGSISNFWLITYQDLTCQPERTLVLKCRAVVTVCFFEGKLNFLSMLNLDWPLMSTQSIYLDHVYKMSSN